MTNLDSAAPRRVVAINPSSGVPIDASAALPMYLVDPTTGAYIPVNRALGYNAVNGPSGGDDTAAIQAAISAFGVAYLGPGTWRYTTLDLSVSGAALVGAGYGETFLMQAADGDGIKVNVGGGAQVNNVVVRDLMLGAQTDRASGAALRLGYVGNVSVSNVRISNSLGGKPYEGLRIDRASDVRFANLRVDNTASSGAVLRPGSASSVIVEIYFDWLCEFRSCGADGMYLLMDQAYSSGVCSLEGVHSAASHYNNAKAGVRIHATVAGASPRNLHFEGASFDSNQGTSIVAQAIDAGLVADASFNGTAEIRRLHIDLGSGWSSFNGGDGIYLNGARDFTVIGGSVRLNRLHGVNIQNSRDGYVETNAVDNSRAATNVSSGVNIGGTSLYIAVGGFIGKSNDSSISHEERGLQLGASLTDIDASQVRFGQFTTAANRVIFTPAAAHARIKLPPGETTAVKTGAYNVLPTDAVVRCDTTSAGFTVTLPRANAYTDREIVVKRSAGANAVTVAADSGTVETTSVTTTPVRYRSDGTNWIAL